MEERLFISAVQIARILAAALAAQAVSLIQYARPREAS